MFLMMASASMLSGVAFADINQGSHLNTGGQSKVNKALAKGYLQGGNDGAKRMESQSQVNIGSKRAGTCTMNVGTQPTGGAGSKEVIVTSKEIINICK
jgi:hypothetical protein